MKKKNLDSQKASELLQKLQEAVLSSSQKKDSREEAPDSDELEFQKKIAGMLSRVTGGKNSDSKAKKSSKKKQPKPAPPAPDLPPQPEPTPFEEPVEEIPLSLPEELPEQTEEIAPIVEEEPMEEVLPEEPAIEVIAPEEPVAEDPTVEESAIEEELATEEPVTEELFIEEIPIEEDLIEEPLIEEDPIEETVFEEPFVEEAADEEPIDTVVSEQTETPLPEPQPEESAAGETPLPPSEPKKPLVRVIGPVIEQESPKAPKKPTPVKETPSDTIVIKPKSDLRSTTPIVIKPKRPERSPEPIRVEGNASMPRTTQKIIPPQKPQASSPRPTPAKPAARTGERSGVSLPRSADARRAPATKGKSAQRSQERTAPVRPRPEDEGLDVVLEHVAQEDTFTGTTFADGNASAANLRGNVHALTHEELLRYVERKTGMTPDDVSMILELGYDHELGRLIGSEPLRQLKTAHLRATRPSDPSTYRTAFGYRNHEYTGEESGERILSNYARDKKTLLVRLVITALLTLLLLPIEIPALFGEPFSGIRERIPQLLPLSAILILAIAGFFSYRQIRAGLQSFFRFAPTPYSVCAILYPIGLFSEIANVFLVGRGGEILSGTLPVLAALLLTAVMDAARLSSEMRVFRILANAADKTVLEPAESHKQKLRHGDKIVKIVNDDVDQSLYKLHRAKRVTGFFRRCNDTSSAARPFGILLLVSAALAFLVGFVCAVSSMQTQSVISAVILTLLFSLPLPAVLLFYYPLCHANRLLNEKGCALVGEESVMEYAKQKTVIFHDSDLYLAKKCTQTMVREGEDFRRDMQLASILFRKMNGAFNPLCKVNPSDPSVTFVRLGESGTEAVIDNHYHLLAGDAAFLTKSGVRIPKESTDRAASRAENVSVTYIAINGVLKLTYEIEYEVSPKFEQTVMLLSEHATDCAIRTYDPAINDAFLQASRAEGVEYVRVIKPGKYENDDATEISDCGALALGDRFDAVRPLVAANVIGQIRSVGYHALPILAIIGATLSALISFRMTEMLPGIPLLLALAFQGVGTLAAWLATHLSFRFGSAQNFK